MIDLEQIVDNRWEQAKILGVQVLLWMILYRFVVEKCKVKGLKKREQDDTNNRIVSIVHGILSFTYACYHLYTVGPSFGQYNTNSQVFLLLASTAYFIQDLIFCTLFKLSDLGLYLHHSLAITGYMSGVYALYGATDGIWGIFYAEISNVPMHVRAILRNLGLRYTKAYELCELSYIIIYAIARGVFTPVFLVYPCVLSQTTPFLVKCICVGIFLQSVIYIREMIKIMKRKKRQLRERSKKNISYFWLSENPQIYQLEYVQQGMKKDKIF